MRQIERSVSQKMRGERRGHMMRTGTRVAALIGVALLLAGCGGNLLGSSTNIFGSSKATTGGAAAGVGGDANVTGTVDRATFTHVDSEISFPLPQPLGDIDSYVVYVGFDPVSAPPEKKKPAAKPKPKRVAKPK